ncbi:MAG: type IV toxin-antitoxin system AbiEi family antitoxin domain-containing protein [Anaerolineae bacterium]
MLSELAAQGRNIFTVEDARAAPGSEGTDVVKLLYRLAAKRWVRRLERGRYRLVPLEAGPEAQWAEHEFLVAATLVQPYYLAYATALHYYGYSERQPRPVWIATTRRKRPVTIEGITYRFVTLSEHKFFGYTTIQLLDTPVKIAEREKAIADGFDHPEYCGGVIEPAKGLWFGSDELDLARLVEYSQHLGNRAAMRRLGFWLERLGTGDQELLRRLEPSTDRNYALLDPRGPANGPRDAHWRLIINVPERQLLEVQAQRPTGTFGGELSLPNAPRRSSRLLVPGPDRAGARRRPSGLGNGHGRSEPTVDRISLR